MGSLKRFFDVLDLPENASISDVRRRYLKLKELFSGESIEIAALNADYGPDDRQRVVADLDEAFAVLKAVLERGGEAPEPAPLLEKPPIVFRDIRDIDPAATVTGEMLRNLRLEAGISLDEMASVTRIQKNHLENIENENFAAMPAAVYVRGYVIQYARHIGIDPDRAVADYMKRFEPENK